MEKRESVFAGLDMTDVEEDLPVIVAWLTAFVQNVYILGAEKFDVHETFTESK